jgi:hypothetical protein
VDAAGGIVREAKVASEPEALIGFLGGLPRPVSTGTEVSAIVGFQNSRLWRVGGFW